MHLWNPGRLGSFKRAPQRGEGFQEGLCGTAEGAREAEALRRGSESRHDALASGPGGNCEPSLVLIFPLNEMVVTSFTSGVTVGFK